MSKIRIALLKRLLVMSHFKISDEWYGDVRFVRYVTPAEFSAFEQTNIQFGESIQLEQYALSTEQLNAGDVLQLRFRLDNQ